MTLKLDVGPNQPVILTGSGVDGETIATGLRQYLRTVGEPVRDRAWLVPAVSTLIVAAAVLPLVVLWARVSSPSG